MRGYAPLLALFATAAAAADFFYEEPRDLSLNAEGLEALTIRSGAGSLRVTGVAGTGTIVVKAVIRVPGVESGEARRIIGSDCVLSLVRIGRRGVLEARFKDHDGSIALEVTVPEAMRLDVTDGSGSVEILDVRSAVGIVDGSGAITLRGIGGSVTVDDGSGSFSAEGIDGDLSISDKSGDLWVLDVRGSVRIVDGSGGIVVSGVGGDLEIPEAGSGGVEVSDVSGRILRDGG